jgi:hypothetical protein
MHTADRSTHIKIVVVGLAAALLISVIAVSAYSLKRGSGIMTARAPTMIKAGGPVFFTKGSDPVIR